MVRRRCLAFLAGLFLLIAGCHIQNCELVETALRDRECKLRELSEELDRLRGQNASLERELGVVRTTDSSKVVMPSPELASQTYTLTTLELGMQTGGYNNDRVAGDEMLQVVVIPKDPDKHAIKAPGTLDVFAYEITQEGIKNPIGSWRVSPDQLRKTWSNNILASAYFVRLPWKAFPTLKKMRVLTRFTLNDNRRFEAEKDFEVMLVEPQDQKIQPCDYPDVPLIMESVPSGPAEMTLPMPRKAEPPVAPPSEGPVIPAPKTTTAETASHWQPAQSLPPLSSVIQLQKPIPRSRPKP
jgi:hypothetical protein